MANPIATSPTTTRVLYWFRTDLRLHDSPALNAALSLNPSVIYPCWLWDPHYVYRARVGPNRWQYLLDCMNDVSQSLTKLNPRQKLLVVREEPQTGIPKLLKQWKITHLVFEKDTDAYAKARDEVVIRAAREMGVEVVVRSGRTLWDSDDLVRANGGRPTMSITQVQHAAQKLGPPARPLPAPTSLPDPGETTISFDGVLPSPTPDFNSSHRTTPDSSYTSLTGPNNDFAPPTLSELGMKPSTTSHRGGETIGLAALDAIIANEHYTATFEKPNTAPTAFEPQSTTLLSPHMHFGSLSCRLFYWRAQDIVTAYETAKKPASKPPTSLTGQLMFRDMYFGAQAALGFHFAQTYRNETTRFIPWHLPSRIDKDTGLITGEYDVDSAKAQSFFLRWKWGRTGFPWIDALMRQLRLEGWIHHLGRHAVACFLTRGGCYVDWERGAEVFEEWLIDHETASNSGNWQWLSCVAFYSQFYRCYSPIAFPFKWDKHGLFVRKYVPELKHFSDKYIYEPWKAPIADQKAWGCVVRGDGGYADAMEGVGSGGLEGQGGGGERLMGLDVAMEGETLLRNETLPRNEASNGNGSEECKIYPKPMFDFATQREICINGLKQAYHVGLRGNSAKVLDGSWRELFDDDAEGPTEGVSGLPGAMIGLDGGERGSGRERGVEAHTGDDSLGRSAAVGDGSGGALGAGAGGGSSGGVGRKHARDETDDATADDGQSSPKVVRKSTVHTPSPRKSSVQTPSPKKSTLQNSRTTRKSQGQQQATLDAHLRRMS